MGREVEAWRDIPDWPGYQVSDQGRVSSSQPWRGSDYRILRPGDNGRGYEFVHLWRDGHKQRFYVHRLVAAAFLGPPPDGLDVNHKNGKKADNRLANIEYVTKSENAMHARVELKRRPNCRLTADQVRGIRTRYEKGETTHKALADELGVAEETVRLAVSRQTWRHIA